jgi:hypothetical protein
MTVGETPEAAIGEWAEAVPGGPEADPWLTVHLAAATSADRSGAQWGRQWGGGG